MSVYKLAASSTGGSQDAIAQLDIQFDGIITAMHGSVANQGTTAGNSVEFEASFLSVNTINTNDTRGSLFTLGMRISAAGAGNTANSGVGGLAIAVNAGERVWLHALGTASVSGTANIYIYVEDGQGVPVANRRR